MGKIFYLLVFVSVLLGCNSLQQGAPPDNIFRYNESKGIPTLDPAFARNLAVIWPMNQLYNGLTQLSDSLTVEPCIAHSWTIDESGTIYTFNLRTDVFFHDSPAFQNGQPRNVVASDFVFTFDRILNPEVASPGAWIFSNLDTKHRLTINGCRAENDSTLKIFLKKPFPAFLGLLSMPYAYVVPFEAIEYYGKDFRSNPVGTGPFQFKVWREGEKLVFVRNPNYFELDEFGERLPYLSAVNISFIADKQSEFLEFLLGRIDFLSGVHSASKDELLTKSGNLNHRYNGRVKMITGPYLNTEYLGILVDPALDIVKSSPLRKIEVRKAIAYGFDRQKLMTHLRSNMGYPAYFGFVPKGMPGFSERVSGYTYNPELSRKLLAQAGYPNGEGMEPITVGTTEDYVDILEFIQHQLAGLGIKINIEVIPGAPYREMMAHSKLVMFRGSWVADYADAENYLALFSSENFSPSGPNYTHFYNPIFDNLYKKALLEPNDSVRYEIYQKMDSLGISYASVIPMYYDKAVRFVNPSIEGMKPNPMNLLTLKRVKKTS